MELRAIADRLFDLLSIVRTNYYHPSQNGSWSIKAVLPSIAPNLGYAGLGEVSDGGSAQLAYLEMTGGGTLQERKNELDVALRRYCRRDTEGMVAIARQFRTSSQRPGDSADAAQASPSSHDVQ